MDYNDIKGLFILLVVFYVCIKTTFLKKNTIGIKRLEMKIQEVNDEFFGRTDV